MTEAQWHDATGPGHLLKFVEDRASPRKLRLFGCACGRRVCHLMPDNTGETAIAAAERFADGTATPDELKEAHLAVGRAAWGRERERDFASRHALAAAMWVADSPIACWEASTEATKAVWTGTATPGTVDREGANSERAVQAVIFRDLFGNPFRPVAFDPRWRTADVLALARGIYEDRAFDRLPLLAD